MAEVGPKPSRTRAAASFLAGLTLFAGAGALGTAALFRRDLPSTEPRVLAPGERVQINVAFLLLYAGAIGGVIVGWLLVHSFWGTFVGAILGWLAGSLVGLLAYLSVSLIARARR